MLSVEFEKTWILREVNGDPNDQQFYWCKVWMLGSSESAMINKFSKE